MSNPILQQQQQPLSALCPSKQESCAIAKMTARCTLYISGSNEPLRRYGHSRIVGATGTSIFFWGGGSRTGSAMAPFERAMVVSYRLSIVTIALSVTFQPQFAIECLRRSNQRGGSLWAQIWGCSPWSRPMMFESAESEHPRLTNGEIISDVFQPMWSQSANVTDRRTDGRTDRQTTCDRNTALCTKVHRAVKAKKT